MAKNWYPVIDYMLCKECGTCNGMCAHGVYDQSAAPTPRVIHPENCVDHCHGCGSMCPTGAITYLGDDTGWTPPARHETEPQTAGCCCGGAGDETKNSCSCCGD
ncbi:MAG: ferredoxin family protein [Chordicoccus sp.]